MQRYRSTYQPRSIRRLEKKSRRNILLSVIVIFSLIYFMATWGLPALIGGLSFFNKFKPSTKVNSVSEETVIAPPVLNIPFDATNSATIKISGYSTPKYKVEIYIDNELKNETTAGENGSFQSDAIPLSLGTNNIYGLTVNEDGKKSLPSKTIKLLYSSEKPKLELSEPADGQQIQGGDKKVSVSGKTDATSSLAINGNTVIINGDGNFSKTVDINEGDNVITVVATNLVGNTSQVERRVTYLPQ